jgi:hypothetical protein
MKKLLLLSTVALLQTCYSQQPGAHEAERKPLGSYHPLTLASAGSETQPSEAGGDQLPSNTELAKQVQNPIAKLISVPFQNNFNFGIGANHVTEWVMNFQPVIPIRLSEDWNVITRTILPTIHMPSPAPGIRSAFGLGDLNPTGFISPATKGKFVWGVGPSMTFPTATDPLLGSGMFSAGPGVVGVLKTGPWVIGMLGNNQWSYAGWRGSPVNALLLQPLLSYNFKYGWYLNVSPILTANWEASHDNVWTVPIGGGVGKVQRLGKLPVNIRLAAYYNVLTPKDMGADWQFRFEFAFLFPERH